MTPWPAALFGLLLLAAPAVASAQTTSQAQADRLTPRPPPTAVLPKATPVHAEPRGKAPAGLAVLLPLPVVPAPLSPVFVPGEALPVAPAPSAAAPPPAKPKPAPAPEKLPEKLVVEKKTAEKKPAEKKSSARTVYAKDDVYVRAAPDRGGKVLDALEPGAAVELVPGEAEAGWARVARNGKVLGWVSSGFLLDRAPSRTSDDGCALPPDFPSKRGTPIAEGSAARALADANIRQSPACNARVLDVLEEGDAVTVTGSSGTWYRVARKGRTLGYVSAPLLGEAKGR